MKKLVVITGATSGIGAAISNKFDEYNLLLLGRRVDRLSHFQGDNIMTASVDINHMASFQEAVSKAEKKFGPVDCLINNAGLMLLGQMDIQSSSEWEAMVHTNVIGMANGIQTVLHSMKQRKVGTIINISSIAGIKAFPNHAMYCATKYAVRGLSETLRMEMAPFHIRVMIISPGVVETELLSHTTSEDIKNNYTQWKQSIGGAIRPEVIADCAYFMYTQPQNTTIRELVVAPTEQVD